MNDPVVARRWPAITQQAAAAGLAARFVAAEDDTVDDAIEFCRMRAGPDEDLGDIQLCGRDGFCGNTWTSEKREARRQGPLRPSAEAAFADLIGYLRRDGML
jgi:hypothetical protein